MDALELYKAGQLGPAIEALGLDLRRQPTDTKRRTFLFELLCFAGSYDRAEKQLDILAEANKDALAGAMLYRAALHGQRTREELFAKGELPLGTPSGAQATNGADASEFAGSMLAGSINGEAFTSLTDGDERIGANLEVFIAGSYTWVPFRYIERVEIAPPKRLRDLLWATALLTTTPEFRLQDLGEVLIPVLAPGSAHAQDDAVRLGRTTVIEETDAGLRPLGQKILLADLSDGEEREFSLLDLRELVFTHASSGAAIEETQQAVGHGNNGGSR